MNDQTEVRIPVSRGKMWELCRTLLPPGHDPLVTELPVHIGYVSLIFVCWDNNARPKSPLEHAGDDTRGWDQAGDDKLPWYAALAAAII